jgi:hypothetical protein
MMAQLDVAYPENYERSQAHDTAKNPDNRSELEQL